MKPISGRPAFERLFRQGIKIHKGWLSLAALPNGRKVSRFGVVIGRGALLSGVKRSRFKRWLREAFRITQEKSRFGWDAAFVISKPPQEASFKWVLREVCKLLEILELKRKS